jgi:serine/threonine-protein kinase
MIAGLNWLQSVSYGDLPRSHPHLTDVRAQLLSSLSDRYAIDREIGRGGMATVFLARDIKHDRQVALKVLDPELGAVLGAERFLAEIRVTANLQHPNLLPLFDSGEAGGLLFYVMPFVEGESLRARLDREKQLPIDEAIHFASAIATALEYAHDHGVIHRDLKPENILLQAGQPVIADFGIALAVSNAGGARITQTGLSLGTPQYMSPEQATGDRGVDGRTDIYSLGAMTYEMLTGEAPHTGNTAQAIVAKLMTEEVRPLTVLRRNVPPHVDAAVRHALEKLPADRFATAREFADALSGRGALAYTTERGAPATTGAHRDRWRYAGWAVAAVITVAALAFARTTENGAADVVVSTILPPAGLDFSEQSSFGAISPDGRRFAFVTLGARGETKLWIRRLDTLTAQPLTGTDGARAPFWSPDNKHVAYFAGDALFTVDASGSAPRQVCEAPNASSGAWGTGDIMVVATPKGILKTTPSGPTCTVAIAPLPGVTTPLRHPALLPDGRHVLFTASHKVMYEIVAGDLHTGEYHTLSEQVFDPIFVAPDILVFGETGIEGTMRLLAQRFNPSRLRLDGQPVAVSEPVRAGGGVLAYTVSAAGPLVYLPGLGDNGEVRTDRTGRVLDTVASRGAWMHAWARNHQWIAHSSDVGVTKFDLSKRVDLQMVRVASFGAASPAWSPRDSLLAYSTCDTTVCRLMTRDLTTDRESTLATGTVTAAYWPSSWSADGRYLVASRIDHFSVNGAQIWVYDALTRKLTQLFVDEGGAIEGAISPDGHWIAYRSEQTGVAEVMLRPFMRDGAPQRVSTSGGRSPLWRNDGRELVFESPDGRVMSAEIQPGPTFSFKTPRPLFSAPAWTRHVSFDIGTSYGMSPDAQQFTFRMTATGSTAVLVQNWKTLLK